MSSIPKPPRQRLVVVTGHSFPPEAETQVICPVCQKGMVPPAVAAMVERALRMLNPDDDR